MDGATYGNRTRARSLGSSSSTIKLKSQHVYCMLLVKNCKPKPHSRGSARKRACKRALDGPKGAAYVLGIGCSQSGC